MRNYAIVPLGNYLIVCTRAMIAEICARIEDYEGRPRPVPVALSL